MDPHAPCILQQLFMQPAQTSKTALPPDTQMVEQQRKLPPLLNERSLFTRASTYGDKEDPLYHSPCNRIAHSYSPGSSRAAAVLFEQFTLVSREASAVLEAETD